jgi:hypothetical protein
LEKILANIRDKLVRIALEWQEKFGVAPAVTSAISEYDAAKLLGCSEVIYSAYMENATAVRKGYDFIHKDKRYQIKANRPSGRKGSKVSLVKKPTNYEWDFLIWILYDRKYVMQEAYKWGVKGFQSKYQDKIRLSPKDMRSGGKKLFPKNKLF